MINSRKAFAVTVMSIWAAGAMAQSTTEPVPFPVEPFLFVDEPFGGCEGISFNGEGRLYIVANREGKIWRYDPATDEMLLIAEGMFGCASLAFGEGEFDRQSIYATTTFAQGRGGKIWRVPVGVTGARLYR